MKLGNVLLGVRIWCAHEVEGSGEALVAQTQFARQRQVARRVDEGILTVRTEYLRDNRERLGA